MATDQKPRAPDPLSVVLITHDAARHLERCLRSVGWADELIVVDSGSTDGTREIAAKAGARVVLQTEWKGFGAQKNFAISLARGEWILLLDADEVVDERLAAAIRRATERVGSAHGYSVRRINYFAGQRMRFGRWRPEWMVRLFQTGRGSVSEDVVHEHVTVDGNVGRLEGELHHYTTDSIADRIRKNEEYTNIIARQRYVAGRRVSAAHLLAVFPLVLFRDLCLRLGFLDGKAGVVVCALGAFYDFSKYAKVWEMERRARRGHSLELEESRRPPAEREKTSASRADTLSPLPGASAPRGDRA